ncbi:MAG TPA: hypothetical protein PLJ64_10105 [Solirubrobacterales bacterium]|nr:hypothetical protein [Solirubrobacterales bacterium]
MPTTKPRYTVTDTGDLENLLDEAQGRWPDVKDRKDLLILLARTGMAKVRADAENRRRVVDETSGALTGVYREDELSRLREDWPE